MTMNHYRNVSSIVLALALSVLPACSGDDPTIIARPGNGGTGSGEPAGGGTGGTAGQSGQVACVESPDAPEEFLNRCTDSACRPFDNAARLSLYRAGQPLPEVP